MKTKMFILLAVMLMASILSNSQTVNGVPLSSIDVQYITITQQNKLLTNKILLEIDYGQEIVPPRNEHRILKNSNGEDMLFNSFVDALNFMYKNGYEFKDSYVDTSNVLSYLLERRKDF